ncbi:MAG TPA: PQQ-binding-like beta-propeller repeat protein, partial [Pirellulales bacterium]
IVRMWNAETGELIWAAKPFPLPLNSARFVDRDRVLVCTDTLQLWNAQTGEPIWTAPRSHPTIAAVNVARDLIVTGSALSTVRFWDLKTGRETANLPASLGRLCVALSPDGNWLVAGGHTGSTDERLLRWRIEYPAAAEAESQTNDESETAGAAPGQTAEPQRELLNVAPLRPGLLRSELLKE